MVTIDDFKHVRGNKYVTPEWLSVTVNQAMIKEGVEGRPTSIIQEGSLLTVKFENKKLNIQW
jgi:hypothetical protein